MKEYVLETNGLTKRYGSAEALSRADIRVEKGAIYGLVGNNGAGKTTLMRMVTGQALPTEGELKLFGASGPKELNRARKRTSAVVETPSFYPYLSGRDNLEYYRIQRGIAGRQAVDEVLEIVDLQDTGRKKFKNYSLGMKQRLGLALAVMNHPDFLILDEPINGLDPLGIVMVRNLLIKLNKERGITILISSHILSELSNLATCYGFIHKGRVVEQISAGELASKCKDYIEIVVEDAPRACQVLEGKLHCGTYEVLPHSTIRIYHYEGTSSSISKCLVENGVGVESIQEVKANLEDYFVKLIGGEIC